MVNSYDMTFYNRQLAALAITAVIVLTISVEPTRANFDILDSLKRVLPDPVSRLVQSWQISDVIYNNASSVKKSQAFKALNYDGETIKTTDFRPLVPNAGNKRKQFSRNGGEYSKRRKTNEKTIKMRIDDQIFNENEKQTSSTIDYSTTPFGEVDISMTTDNLDRQRISNNINNEKSKNVLHSKKDIDRPSQKKISGLEDRTREHDEDKPSVTTEEFRYETTTESQEYDFPVTTEEYEYQTTTESPQPDEQTTWMTTEEYDFPVTTELYEIPEKPKRISKEPQTDIKTNMVNGKSSEPEETTKSPIDMPTTTAMFDDDFMTTEAYDVTTEGLEDWQDMMLRMNNEEENADDIWSRIRRQATDGSTVAPTCATACPTNIGAYCTTCPAGQGASCVESCNCPRNTTGEYCEQVLQESVASNQSQEIEAMMTGEVTEESLAALSESLSANYSTSDGFERVHVTSVQYDAATDETTVTYDVIYDQSLTDEDRTDILTQTAVLVQNGQQVNLDSSSTNFVTGSGRYYTDDGSSEALPQVDPGRQGGELQDVCFMFKRENSCKNGGNCIDENGSPRCLCEEGWKGEYCQFSASLAEQTEDDTSKTVLPIVAAALAVALLVSCTSIMIARRGNKGEAETESTVSDIPRSALMVPSSTFSRGNKQDWKHFSSGLRPENEAVPPLHRSQYPYSHIRSDAASSTGSSSSSWHDHESMNFPGFSIPRPEVRQENELFF